MFGALYAAAGSDPAQLVVVAREFSPRIDVRGPREITLDLSGLARLFGEAEQTGAVVQIDPNSVHGLHMGSRCGDDDR